MKIKTQFHTVEKFLLKPVALDDILLKVRSGTMAKDKRFEIHLEMKRVFGKKSCERSHKWLTENFGYSHVKDVEERYLDSCLAALKRINVVQQKTWNKLEGKKPEVLIPVAPKATPVAVKKSFQSDESFLQSTVDTLKSYFNQYKLQRIYFKEVMVKVITEENGFMRFEVKMYPEGDDLAQACGFGHTTSLQNLAKSIRKFQRIFEAWDAMFRSCNHGRFNIGGFRIKCESLKKMDDVEALKVFGVFQKNVALGRIWMKGKASCRATAIQNSF